MASGSISPKKTLEGKVFQGAGTNDHDRLSNRDKEDQHPITAITDLTAQLKSKLDAATVMPIIEDASKNKAAGLYYDVKKELSTKAYWYLTSKINPDTKQGTKESIISGPYDLGAGGGGGGSGITEITLTNVDPYTKKDLWPTATALDAACNLKVYWSSIKDGQGTGNGTIYIYVNNNLFFTSAVKQGYVTVDVSKAIISGNNKIEVKIIDAYSATKNIIGNITGVSISLTSNFDDDMAYTGDITYTYTPTGDIAKTVHFIVDGVERDTAIVRSTGEQQTYIIKNLSHGAHAFLVYFTADLAGQEIKSNELYYDLIHYVAGRTTPIIASVFPSQSDQEQYVTFNIKYKVYTPGKNDSLVDLLVNGTKEGETLTVNQSYHFWSYRPTILGNNILSIVSGTARRDFNIHVKECSIDVEPVTENLVLALNTIGRNNDNPTEREKWEDKEHGISCQLEGFNWVSNGWVQDSDKNTVLRLSGKARVTIPYKPFNNDVTPTGKTIEFELATTDVKNYETMIVQCLSGGDSITHSVSFSGEDTRTKKFEISNLDTTKFIAKVVGEHKTYLFEYLNNSWTLNGVNVILDDYGITLREIDLDPTVVEPYYQDHDKLTVIYEIVGQGFYITPQLAKLQSRQTTISTQYREGDRVRLSFVIEKRTEYKLVYIYINGIMSGVTKYPTSDSFRQNEAQNIIIGAAESGLTSDATVDIHNIRIYDNNLTRKQIVNNWIADTQDIILKTDRYKHNDNYDERGNIIINKLPGDLPYLVLAAETLPTYKKDKRSVDATFVYPGDEDRSFTSASASADVQGTSSQYYYRKNFKIKFGNGFLHADGNLDTKYKLRPPISKKEKTFTFKADVASSEGANNVELTRYFEDTKNWYSPPQLNTDPEDTATGLDTKKRIRVGIDGYPIVLFHNNGDTVSFYGKMNFNNDKGNDSTFGFNFDSYKDECWEITNNNNKLVLFQDDDMSIWQESFESRFPETLEDASGTEHTYGTKAGELDKLTEVIKWIVSTRRLDTDSEETKKAKLNKFKTELTNYFDLKSSLFYYLYTELFLMVDSRAKNAMLTYFGSRQTGDGGNKWFWLPYDMDTALGINNEGLLIFNYDAEDTDLHNGGNIYNGQQSTFWNNIRDAFSTELSTMYADLRSSNKSGSDDKLAWSYDNIEKYYTDHQAYWSENIFNEDEYIKYLEPYIKNNDATYLGMAQGSKAEQRRWWLYNRFKYLDSKYKTGAAKDNTIMLRAYQKGSFKVNPYINCYATAVFDQDKGNNFVTKKAKRSVITDIVPPESWDPAGTDSVVVLYSADELRDIGDISDFNVGFADFSKATKLQKLIIGNPAATYANEHLTSLNVGNNHLITEIDARNCVKLGTEATDATRTIKLQACYSLEKIYFDNTQILGCELPVGGNLKVIHLPMTITDLIIRNHPFLEELQLGGTSRLEKVWLEDIPSSAINAYDIVHEMADDKIVRLININETFFPENGITPATKLENFYTKLDNMKGCDSKGDTTEKAQVTGKIALKNLDGTPATISYQKYTELTAKYPEVKIEAQVICTVTFWKWEDEQLKQNKIKLEEINVKQGGGVIPTTPTQPSTQEWYYTFTSWNSEAYKSNVQTDLDILAVFEAHKQQYTATFDPQSPIITVTPPSETVEYGSLIHSPTVSDVPELVTLEGWYYIKDGINTQWDFASDKLYNHTTLKAKWIDSGSPVVTLERTAFNAFKYTCTDNVGIIAWAVTTSEEEPTTWTYIEATAKLTGTYQIEAAGTYYFWVKDTADNIGNKSIIAYSITKTFGTGANEIILVENNTSSTISNFALKGTDIKLNNLILDDHYETPVIKLNDTTITIGYIQNCQQNLVYNLTCSPKSYLLHFDNRGRGVKPDDQTIVYLHKAIMPDPQYELGYILEGWYKDVSFENKWNFNSDVIHNETTLYAKWIEYHDPSTFTINLTKLSDDDTNQITVYYNQAEAGKVSIDWGDDTPETTSDIKGVTSQTHTYSERKVYTLSITGNCTYLLGQDISYQAIMPIKVLTDINFAWDVSTTLPYAFRGATNLEKLSFNEFISTIAEGTFSNCENLKYVHFSDSIKEIGIKAFTNCSSLIGESSTNEVLKLGNRTAAIRDLAFSHCSSLEKIILPESLTSLGNATFYSCVQLKDINIPSGLTILPKELFLNCIALTSMIIPRNITYLGQQVLGSCYSLSYVKLENENLTMAEQSGCFNNCFYLKTIGPISDSTSYDIEYAWKTEIPDDAFYCAYSSSPFNSIVLPQRLTKIGDRAFAHSNLLTNITLPSSLEYIGSMAFYGSGITNINIPFATTIIGANAFTMAEDLRNVYLHNRSATLDGKERVNHPASSWFLGCKGGVGELTVHIRADILDPRVQFGAWWDCYEYDYFTQKAKKIAQIIAE